MKVLINESQKIESLEIIDPRTGLNYISDFVGNTGALSNGEFEYDEDKDAYICDQDTYNWWNKVVGENQLLENRVYGLTQEHGSDAVYDVVHDAGGHDLEDHAAYVNQALDEFFNDQ